MGEVEEPKDGEDGVPAAVLKSPLAVYGSKGFVVSLISLILVISGGYQLWSSGDAYALLNLALGVFVILFFVIPFILRGPIILEPRGLRVSGKHFPLWLIADVRVTAVSVPNWILGSRSSLRLEFFGPRGSLLHSHSDRDFTKAEITRLAVILRHAYPELRVEERVE